MDDCLHNLDSVLISFLTDGISLKLFIFLLHFEIESTIKFSNLFEAASSFSLLIMLSSFGCLSGAGNETCLENILTGKGLDEGKLD